MVVLYYQNHAPNSHSIEFQSSRFIFTYVTALATSSFLLLDKPLVSQWLLNCQATSHQKKKKSHENANKNSNYQLPIARRMQKAREDSVYPIPILSFKGLVQ